MSSYDLAEVWVKFLEKFHESTSENVYNAWIKPLIPLEITDTYLKVGAKNNFTKKWLEETYTTVIEGMLASITGTNLQFKIENLDLKTEELPINSAETTPVQTENFTWNTTLNLSHNKNTVDKLSNNKYQVGTFTQGDPMVAGVSSNGYTQRIMEGQPLGTFFTYEFAGYKDGKASYYVRDEETGKRTGETTSEPAFKDRAITGCAQPKLNLGWNNSFNYKNWNATIFITGVFGNKIYNGARANYSSPEMFANGKNVLKEFITDRPATDTGGNIPSDRFIENGSYLRLSNLTLGYTFKNLDGWLQSAQLYVSCNNLFTITGYKGLDPEVNMGGLAPGVDYRWSTYPHSRTTMVGLKVNF